MYRRLRIVTEIRDRKGAEFDDGLLFVSEYPDLKPMARYREMGRIWV